MKAAIFENPGLENLRVMDNIKEPQITGHDVLIKVKVAGINPIDNFVVSGALPKLIPLPNHMPGAEISGVVEEVGSHINGNNLRIGDRVIVQKQLFKPVIRIFQNSKTLDELLPVISKYVTQKREANSSSQHAFLYAVARDMIKSRKTTEIESSFIWNYIRENLQGVDIPRKPLSYDTSEFGTISQKEIILIYEHVFGAKTKKTNGIRKVYFNIPKLQRLGKVYDLATEIKVIRDGDDSFEQNRGSDWTDWTDVGLDRHIAASTDERGLIANTAISERENGPSNGPVDSKHPVHPPDPPHPTLSPMAEAGIGIGIGVYRLEHSDTFACHNCKMRGDKWFMEGHECSGKGRGGAKEVK